MNRMNEQVLNLDRKFTPHGPGIDYEAFVFPGGEVHIKIKNKVINNKILITVRITTSDYLILLLLATDALRRLGAEHIEVFIPYLPYARQDRVMVEGEPLSLKVFCEIINSQHYNKVHVFDAHSDVSPALLNNVAPISNHSFVKSSMAHSVLSDDFILVSPDAGAYKKVFNLSRFIGYKYRIVCAQKVRDVTTGAIVQTLVTCEDFKGWDVFIVDDICDGGRTFIELAKVIKQRNCGKIILIVSHGIFSKGFRELGKHIDHIYTTNSIKDINNIWVTQLNLTLEK